MTLEGNSSFNQTNNSAYAAHHGRFSTGSWTHDIKITITSLYAVSFLFGFVGNALGLYIICRKCGMKAATHLLIGNLACSNLLITLIVMPMSVFFLYNEHRWHAGTAGTVTCKLSQYLFLFPIATSILTILVVSIDRFFAVFHPLKAKVFRRPKIMTATIWICAAILMSPTLAIYKVISSPDGKWFCVSYFGQESHRAVILSKVYYSLIFVLLYLLPLFAIAVLYALICYKLYHRKVPGLSRTQNYRETVEKSKRKVVKVLIMIVVVFALCWFPAHAMHYFITFQSEFYARMPAYLFPLLLWISHTNSAIEPCLYMLLSQNFRKEFRQVISHCGSYQKELRLGNRLSRLTFNFSKRNWDAYRNGSFIFRKAGSYKVASPHDMESEEKDNVHGLNMRNWSPTEEYNRSLEKLDDHVL
ncbi:prolactin-releasing peptide receptor-like [Orbicella faveolata]|uniref:prolactin-releasing peptide receptor-like n=1 Tax=Orbicella faveolata TaxID=48498 RepID=UPI0009E5EB17|nr:prolactin-releasing peptide receptor-like [Orbicella faveolata]XP_020607031.1 prolactin-releasing peptide receptor-like [Orbicella faveolata]